MIKLKTLLSEGPISYQNYATDSKDGASKGAIKDSWWAGGQGQGIKAGTSRIDKKESRYQVSEPAGFDKPIKFEKIKTIESSIQVGSDVVPGNEEYALYTLKDFLKDVKKMGGYKLKKTSVKTHFTLHKGGNTYALYFTPSMAGTYVSLKSRL
jgi:hypothetical protein